MTQNRKKLLIVCPFSRPNVGGVETHIEKLTNYAIEKGYFVTLLTYQPLTTNDRGLSLEKGENFEIHRVSWFGRGWFPKLEKYFPLTFLYLFPGLFVKSFIYYSKNKNEIDCIHAHGLVAASIVKLLNLILGKKRSVVSTHAVYHLTERPLLAKLFIFVLKDFDKILAVSEVSRNELIKIGLDENKVAVHPNWIPTEIFKPLDTVDFSVLLKIKESFNLLFIGRLNEMKGIKLFLDAAKALPDIGFHIVGNGPMENEVKTQASLVNNIYYYGILKQTNGDDFKKILNLYTLCNYLVSPYLYDEGYSAVLIESVACGTKVIITKRGSPPTFMDDTVAIYLSPNPTSEELIALLTKLQKENSPKISYSNICREFALKNFGPINADIIINSYENI
jgi:glycosyltransferase involved in cell wall biosynthesis